MSRAQQGGRDACCVVFLMCMLVQGCRALERPAWLPPGQQAALMLRLHVEPTRRAVPLYTVDVFLGLALRAGSADCSLALGTRAAGWSSCSVCSPLRRQAALWLCMLAREDKLPKCMEDDVNEVRELHASRLWLRTGAALHRALRSKLRICELHRCISRRPPHAT